MFRDALAYRTQASNHLDLIGFESFSITRLRDLNRIHGRFAVDLQALQISLAVYGM